MLKFYFLMSNQTHTFIIRYFFFLTLHFFWQPNGNVFFFCFLIPLEPGLNVRNMLLMKSNQFICLLKFKRKSEPTCISYILYFLIGILFIGCCSILLLNIGSHVLIFGSKRSLPLGVRCMMAMVTQ